MILYQWGVMYNNSFNVELCLKFRCDVVFMLCLFSVARDDLLAGTELTSKLEPAFLSGLRCQQPSIRQKFVEVFDNSIKRRLFDRLLYITCSQNWEAMGGHFWIKQCIEVQHVWCLVWLDCIASFEIRAAKSESILIRMMHHFALALCNAM